MTDPTVDAERRVRGLLRTHELRRHEPVFDVCFCGWRGVTHPAHQAEVLAQAGVLATPDHDAQVAAKALNDAADAVEGMHDPVAPDCREWADWLRARAERTGQA